MNNTLGAVIAFRFIDVKLLQFANILFIVSTFDVLKFGIYKSDNCLQFLNILDMSVTFEVTKDVKSKIIIFLHSSNMEIIVSTLVTSNLLIFKSFNPVQDLNIYPIFTTFLVSKELKSKDLKLEQLKNILFIFSTFEVLKLLIFNFSSLLQL